MNNINFLISILLERFKLSSPKIYAIIAVVLITLNSVAITLMDQSIWSPTEFWKGILVVLSQIILALPSTSTKRFIDPEVAKAVDQVVAKNLIDQETNEC